MRRSLVGQARRGRLYDEGDGGMSRGAVVLRLFGGDCAWADFFLWRGCWIAGVEAVLVVSGGLWWVVVWAVDGGGRGGRGASRRRRNDVLGAGQVRRRWEGRDVSSCAGG